MLSTSSQLCIATSIRQALHYCPASLLLTVLVVYTAVTTNQSTDSNGGNGTRFRITGRKLLVSHLIAVRAAFSAAHRQAACTSRNLHAIMQLDQRLPCGTCNRIRSCAACMQPRFCRLRDNGACVGETRLYLTGSICAAAQADARFPASAVFDERACRARQPACDSVHAASISMHNSPWQSDFSNDWPWPTRVATMFAMPHLPCRL